METPRKLVVRDHFTATIPEEYVVDDSTELGGSIAVLKAARCSEGPVVLKVPLPVAPSRSIQAIRHEARILSAVQHPNIVSVVDFVEEEHILVTERLGDNLEYFLTKNDQPSLVRAFEMMRDILKGLTALHAARIAHCDLVARNVVFKGQKLVLIDFDVATEFGNPCPITAAEQRPPEYVEGMSVEPALDIFNLGLLMCRVFWKSLPPSPYKELIDMFLNQDPNDRPSAADALEGAMLALDRLKKKRGVDQAYDCGDPTSNEEIAAGPTQPNNKCSRRA
ncbi:hypothetical protein BSKO_12164 [Bryopsis sp. KO-2023]|nr:hypothetical protein BSKO_12164 [Bryopsis sp. KO-2023]